MEVEHCLLRQGHSTGFPMTIRRTSPNLGLSFACGHHHKFPSQELSHNNNKLTGLKAKNFKVKYAASSYGGEQSFPTSTADAAKRRSFLETMNTFYCFTRPYSIIGTILTVVSASLLAVESWGDVSPHLVLEILRALIPTILMHIYTVGINQVMDVEIDKVNKPYLPLASGDFSLNVGISLTILCATLAFAFGATVSSKILSMALVFEFLFGCGYSLELPMLRWKKWGAAAALSIMFNRTFAVQICTFLHVQTFALKRLAMLNKRIIFLSCFTCVLISIIGIFKDIPDLEGDKAHGVQSFVVQQGQERVFWFCIYVLTISYILAIIVGTASKVAWAKLDMIVGHGTALVALWHYATQVDPKDRVAMSKFYMFIWKLLYAELFLAHFAR